MIKNKRFTIGLQIDHISSGYSGTLVNTIKLLVEQRDCNFFIFNGSNLGHPFEYEYQQNVIYNYIKGCRLDALILATGTLCNFVSKERFLSFCDTLTGIPLVSLSVPLNGIPSIIIDNKTGLIEAVEHLINIHHCKRIAFIKGPDDNPEAKLRLEAFIEAHQKAGVPVYQELIIPGRFTPPCGVAAAEYLLKNQLQFDAIIGANDDMALSAMSTLQAAGKRIPQNFAVIGFDDSEYVQYCTPPLTSVNQQLALQAELAVQLAYDICLGKNVPEITTVVTRLSVRFSCGCFSSAVSVVNEVRKHGPAHKELTVECFNYLKEHYGITIKIDEVLTTIRTFCAMLIDFEQGKISDLECLKKMHEIFIIEVNKGNDFSYWNDILSFVYGDAVKKTESTEYIIMMSDLFQMIRILLSEMLRLSQGKKKEMYRQNIFQFRGAMQRLISSVDMKDFVVQFQDQLAAFGLKSCFIGYYSKGIKYQLSDTWITPDKTELVLACNDERSISIPENEKIFNPGKNIIPFSLLPSDRRFTFIVSALYDNEEQFGFTVFEPGDRDGIFYETFVTQLRNIFKSTLVFSAKQRIEKELKETLTDLEKSNEKLSRISQTDELTGLYNRRGFINFAQQSLNLAIQMGKSGLLFFADLDGLKKINDVHGHHEGDFAIKMAADILRKTFRNLDLIGRIGGDEFTVLTVNTDESFVPILQNRLNQQITQCNESSGKPYTLGISIGNIPFTAQSVSSLFELLSKADEQLYKQKKQNQSVSGAR